MSPPARRTRVLHVVQSLNYGGMERVLAAIVAHLDPARFEPHVLALQYLGAFSSELQGVAPLHRGDPLPRWSLLWPGALARQMRRIAPDVVHTHSGVWYKASRAARMAGVQRVVHTDHGRRWPEPLFDAALDRRAARYTDVVVAVSDPLAARLRAVLREIRAPIHVVPNGIDRRRFRPAPGEGALRRDLRLPPEQPLLGSVGRLERVKGYDVMLRALALLRGRPAPETAPVLVLIGDGAERERLVRLAARLGVGPHVHFLGWRTDVAELYPQFDLFTLSSHSEGTSVSLLEAMSCGVCPVVTAVGGNADVLGPGLSHRLVPAGDPEALAEAWRRGLADAGTRTADAARAEARVTAHYGAEVMARRYEGLYLGTSEPPAPTPHSDTVCPAPQSL